MDEIVNKHWISVNTNDQINFAAQHNHSREIIKPSIDQARQLKHIRKKLAPHPRSGRVNSVFVLFKVIASGCINLTNYNPTQRTLGIELKRYGYDKSLVREQVNRLWKKLSQLDLFKVTRLNGKVYRYELTELGFMAWHLICLKNNGSKFVDIDSIYSNLSTENELAKRVKSDSEKKCHKSFEKNVTSYIEHSYIEHTSIVQRESDSNSGEELTKGRVKAMHDRNEMNDLFEEYESYRTENAKQSSKTQTKNDVKANDTPKKQPNRFLDDKKISSSDPHVYEKELNRAAHANDLDDSQTELLKERAQYAKQNENIRNVAAYIANTIKLIKRNELKSYKQTNKTKLTEKYISRNAKPRESWQAARARLERELYGKQDDKSYNLESISQQYKQQEYETANTETALKMLRKIRQNLH